MQYFHKIHGSVLRIESRQMDSLDASSNSDETASSDSGPRWSILGLGGLVSLCCLVAPTTNAVEGATAASGATAAVGGGLIQIIVAALTVGVIGLAVRLRANRSCER
jgi:hypothetical protein